jgi:ubiquinone/menaquinone biosynthesis C-methylase UbiE
MKVEHKHRVKVQKHFNRWARSYDNGQLTRWLRAFQQRVIEVTAPQPYEYVLDVGCGTGWAVFQLRSMLTVGRACGIDLSPAMIARARARATGVANVEFQVGDAENIPYDDARFDAVMCSSSFHHYPHPVCVLREFRRVLKPGGRAYLLDTCRDGSLLVCLYDLGHKLFIGDHVRYYHTSEIREFFQQADFSNIQEEFRVQKLFLHKKFLTSVVLTSARKEA